jgi:hypothetical protein
MKKILYTFLLLVLLSSTVASAEEWKLATQNTDMHIGESFYIGDKTLTLSDTAKDSDGNIFAVMFHVYKNGTKIDSLVVEKSLYTEFNEGSHRLCLIRVYNGQIFCSCDYLVRPLFVFSSNTVRDGSYNKTTVYAKLYQANARDIKVSYTVKGIILKGSKPTQKSYSNLVVENNLTDTCIKWKGAGTLTLKAIYKDAEGNKYEQTYDVLRNTVIDELTASGSTKQTTEKVISTSKVSSGRVNAEKKIFKGAITRALKYIDFSNETEADLNRILKEI